MSDEKRDLRRPAVDPSIPVELSRVAEWLSRAELPGTTVSRDELLYRAGWEAGERQRRDIVSSSSRWGERWVTAGWATASALIGIALTIALLKPIDVDVVHTERPTRERPDREDPAPGPMLTGNESALERQFAQPTREPAIAPLAAPTPHRPRTYAPNATLLIERERAVWRSQDTNWRHQHDRASSPVLPSAPRRPASNSAREMLKEFLPDVTHVRPSWLRAVGIHSLDTNIDSPTNSHSLSGTTDHPQA